MRTCRNLTVVFVVTGLLWTVAAQESNSPKPIPPVRASTLIGSTVQNGDGHDLGKLRDFVVDLRSGELKYALVASGGFLGIRSELRAVPAHVIFPSTSKRNVVGLKAARPLWHSAPTIRRSNLGILATREFENRLYAHFGHPDPSHIAAGDNPGGRDAAGRSLSPTGRTPAKESGAPRDIRLGSELVGRTVVDQRQETIGEVLDLFVGFSPGSPSFALISAAKLFDDGRQFLVPLEQVRSTRRDRLMIHTTRRTLASAPVFDPAHWLEPGGANVQIYRYVRPHAEIPIRSERSPRHTDAHPARR